MSQALAVSARGTPWGAKVPLAGGALQAMVTRSSFAEIESVAPETAREQAAPL